MTLDGAPVDAQLRRGVVEFAILALLSREPMYGWQLSHELIDSGGFIGSIGTLYPVLSRLRSKGWVSTYDEPSEAGPARRYYRLTPAGTESLAEFTAQWQLFSTALTSLLEKGPRP